MIPLNLSRLDLAEQVTEKSNTTLPSTSEISFTILSLREAIQAQDTEASCPPKLSDLTENAMNIPEVVKNVLYTLNTGSTSFSGMEPCLPRTRPCAVIRTRPDICCKWWKAEAGPYSHTLSNL